MQKHDTDTVALIVFGLLFGFVTVLGFFAARWRRGDLGTLDEWGLGGRRFGTVVTWFLLGGDLYTAYTFIAVPALVFGAGAQGFFALPYTIIVYPLVFIAVPRLWVVAHRRGYVTPADFVRGRFGSRPLAAAVARHGHAGDDALHRAAARRHAGRAGRDGHQRRLAADHRVRHPRRLHLPERPARAGADRGRQGRADLHHGPRRDHLHPVQARRLRRDLRRRRQGAAGEGPAGGARARHARRTDRLRDAGPRLGDGAVPVPARVDGRAELEERATPSAATPRCCRPTRSCSGLIALLGYMAIAAGIQPDATPTTPSRDSS